MAKAMGNININININIAKHKYWQNQLSEAFW